LAAVSIISDREGTGENIRLLHTKVLFRELERELEQQAVRTTYWASQDRHHDMLVLESQDRAWSVYCKPCELKKEAQFDPVSTYVELLLGRAKSCPQNQKEVFYEHRRLFTLLDAQAIFLCQLSEDLGIDQSHEKGYELPIGPTYLMHLTVASRIELLACLPLVYKTKILPIRRQAAGTLGPTKSPTTFPSDLLQAPIEKLMEVFPRNTSEAFPPVSFPFDAVAARWSDLA
jgi:hypothetical protein